MTSENNDATLVPFVRNGNIITSVLTLDPVKTTDARQYYCQATILVFGTVDRTNSDLTVQSEFINTSVFNHRCCILFLQYLLPVY